jgi:cyclase
MMRQLFCAAAGAGLLAAGLMCLRPVASEVNTVQQVAPGVYFHEGDLHGHGHCNNGWIVFEDYVLVVDANFPSGAKEIIPKIRAVTDKPIRFAFDTHHHGDHAYGNQVWVENGAVPVAHTGVLEEMKKYETGYFGGKPGRWEDAAKDRKDVAESRLKPPTLLFPDRLVFDDGRNRVELLHLGVAHTHGDGWAWLPKERILFSGDACVNGPYNYTGDGNVEQWIRTLEAARKLNPRLVCPGHGPVADASLLDDQRAYFLELRSQVRARREMLKSPARLRTALDEIKAAVEKQERIRKYVGQFFDAQVEKVHTEMGGKPFPPKMQARAGADHARDHGLPPLLQSPPAGRARLAGNRR